MATIADLDALMTYLAQEAGEVSLLEFKVLVVGELRKRHPGEKLYIPAHEVSKKEQILRAAAQMPTGVVAERYGVSSSYVCRVVKRSRKN